MSGCWLAGGSGTSALSASRLINQDFRHKLRALLPPIFCPALPSRCRYAPAEEVGDAITAPRNWHFSNRTEEEAPERGKDASSDGKNPGEKA